MSRWQKRPAAPSGACADEARSGGKQGSLQSIMAGGEPEELSAPCSGPALIRSTWHFCAERRPEHDSQIRSMRTGQIKTCKLDQKTFS